MTGINTRLDNIMAALSARERAVLILGSFKDKAPEDPKWRNTMPADQSPELHRLIGLVNACGVQLAFLITSLKGEVEKLELRVLHLVTLRGWELNLAETDYAVALIAPEPPKESAISRLQLMLKTPYRHGEERLDLSTVIDG